MNLIIEDWRHGWKFYSVWLYALIGALPNLYDAISALGWFGDISAAPVPLRWTIRGIALAGIVVRFIQQNRPALPDATDKAGA